MGKMKALVNALMDETPPHLRFQAFRSRSFSKGKSTTPRKGSSSKKGTPRKAQKTRSTSASPSAKGEKMDPEEEKKKEQEHILWAKTKMLGESFLSRLVFD